MIKPSQPLPNAAESDLPEGWARAPVRDVLDVRYGKGLPEKNRKHGPYAVYGSNGVIGRHDEPLTAGPTIILGRKGTVGAVHYSRQPCWAIDTTYFIERPPDLDMRFLYYALSTLGLSEMDTSSAIPGLNREDVFAQALLLAPLPEQKRIVAKVEALLERVDATRRRLAKVPAILKRFRQSVLAAACSGRLTEAWRGARPASASSEDDELPSGWRNGVLAEMCDSIVDGDHQPPPKQDEGVPFLVIGDISSGSLTFSQTRFVSQEYFSKIKPTRRPARGDVLYTVVGATIGIPVIVNTDRPFCFQRHIALLKPAATTTTGYLHLVMQSRDVYKQAWDNITGTAQPTLPIKMLRDLRVPIPPLPEQPEIARRVEALLTLADRIEAHVRAATVRTERLPQVILGRAFGGELVPTEAELAARESRDYEPASVLLQRVQEARKQQEPAKRGRGGKEMAKRSKRQSGKIRRPLDEVLREQGKPLTPEGLFDLAGFDEGSLDDFYEQLRKLIQDGKVRENRPNKKDVTLDAVAK